MGNNVKRQMSQRQQVRSINERLDAMESTIPQIVMGVNQAMQTQRQEVAKLAAIVEAVVELLGTDTVDAKVKEISDRKILARMEEAKGNLDAALAKGEIMKADTIGDETLIVGREFDANGEVRFPGRVQITFDKVAPEFQEKLKGQGPGFQTETASGGKFEVLEVYAEAPKQETAETPAELDAALSQDEA